MVKLKLKLGGASVNPNHNRPSAAPTVQPSSSYVTAPIPGSGGRAPSTTPHPRPTIKLGRITPTPPPPKVKKQPGRIVLKGPQIPPRTKLVYPPGNGYDSESSEREQDPLIEEQFILRMPPGEDCDFLRQAIEERTLDVKSKNKENDVWIKFKDQRRAVVNVRGHLYAAVLWDLPCVIESCKTLDKKNTFKTADISHILEVQAQISHESQASSYPPPTTFNPPTPNHNPYAYPHGLTAPLKYVRKRRFRRPRFERPIDAVHEEVRRLLKADDEAIQTSNELVDASEMHRLQDDEQEEVAEGYFPRAREEEYDEEDEDVEMVDQPIPSEGGMSEDDLFDEITAAFQDDDGSAEAGEAEIGDESILPATPLVEDDSSSDSDASDLFEDTTVLHSTSGQENAHLDEAAQEAAQETQKIREELADLQVSLQDKLREFEAAKNLIIKERLRGHIENYRAEITMKEQMLKGVDGEDEDDDDMGVS